MLTRLDTGPTSGGRRAFVAPVDPCATPRRGGVLGIRSPAARGEMNIYARGLSVEKEALWSVFDRLTNIDSDTPATPRLVTSWQLGPDALSADVVVREGVRFHPHRCFPQGAAFGPQDVVYSVEYAIREQHVRLPLTGHTLLDARTVRLHFASPPRDLGRSLGRTYAFSSGLEGCADPRTDPQPAGTGPFRWARPGAHRTIRLERFDDYWARGDDGTVPYLDAVEFESGDDVVGALGHLRAGRLDVLRLAPEERSILVLDPLATTPELQPRFADAPASVALWSSDDIWLFALELWSGRTAWMAHPEFRRALHLALDRSAITDALPQPHVASVSFLPAGYLGAAPQPPRGDPRLEAARRALAAAGVPPETHLDLVLGYTRRGEVEEAVRRSLEPLGISVKLVRLEAAAMNEARERHQADGIFVHLVSGPDNAVHPAGHLRNMTRHEGRLWPLAEATADLEQKLGRAVGRQQRDTLARQLDDALRDVNGVLPLAFQDRRTRRGMWVVADRVCGLHDRFSQRVLAPYGLSQIHLRQP